MKTPWTLDGGVIRDADGEAVGVFIGNGGYMAAARWPKAEHVLRCVNNRDKIRKNLEALQAMLLPQEERIKPHHKVQILDHVSAMLRRMAVL